MSEQNQQPEVAAEEQQEAVLQIQRIYVKDVSFEAPNLPHIFHQEWKPKLGFDLSTEAVQVGEDLYEVTLNINVETTMEDSGDVAFICEVKTSWRIYNQRFRRCSNGTLLNISMPKYAFPLCT